MAPQDAPPPPLPVEAAVPDEAGAGSAVDFWALDAELEISTEPIASAVTAEEFIALPHLAVGSSHHPLCIFVNQNAGVHASRLSQNF